MPQKVLVGLRKTTRPKDAALERELKERNNLSFTRVFKVAFTQLVTDLIMGQFVL